MWIESEKGASIDEDATGLLAGSARDAMLDCAYRKWAEMLIYGQT